MKALLSKLPLALCTFFALTASAETRYVDLTSPSPTPPYTNWLTAATNIQDAIDAAVDDDQVLVTNGVYSTGGIVIYGQETNRVALTNAITLLSVNGPQATTIVGGQQTRCVYVGSNAVMSGFTVTNGFARASGDAVKEMSGGGIWCETGGLVTNCVIRNNSAPNSSTGGGGGVYGGILYNCIIVGNSGGGAYGGTFYDCTFTGNTGYLGGGVRSGILWNCTLSSNTVIAYGHGGGAYQCLLSNCVLNGNRTTSLGGGGSGFGAGTFQGTNYNCVFTGNVSGLDGGGAYQSTSYNCLFTENIASYYGGGAYQGQLYNCTLCNNTATNSGGGVSGSRLFNSIVYYNSAPTGSNWSGGSMFFCCTLPSPSSSNITNAPAFVDVQGGLYRLKCGSPCIDAGFTNGSIVATSNDIRGVIRPLDGNSDSLAQFDMGAYEYDPATDLVPSIRKDFSFDNFATFYPVSFVAQIDGCADYFWWDFGDGTTVSNQSTISHAWSSPGTFNVKLSAYYTSLAQSLSVTTQAQVVQPPVYYVDLNSPSPAAPYTNWTSAAHIIQQAVAVGTTPGRLVLVTNGVYRDSGVIIYGSIYNSVALTNPVVVRSANGPDTTIIWPSQPARRCAYVGDNAILSGFTLTGGHTLLSGDLYKEQSGAGVWCETGGVASNCVITGNSAYKNGGGAYQGTFYDCVLSNNVFGYNGAAQGGGIYGGTLYNCTVVSNAAVTVGAGSGAYKSTLYNCLIAGNQSHDIGGGSCSNTLWNCTLVANTAGNGGGSYCDTLYTCLVSGNAAQISGGGAYSSTLYNCLVAGNSALATGGGVYSGTFYNATIVSNTAPTGGGVYAGSQSYAYNSIIFYNTASSSGNNWGGGLLGFNCCSTPSLPNLLGSDNITNDPVFFDWASGNLRLQSNSPCINAGKNAFVTRATDSDGNPRIVGGTVDMGAYECQSPALLDFYLWLQSYGQPTPAGSAYANPDDDAANNWQEWRADTIPTNSLSVLRMVSATNSPTGAQVTWQSVSTRSYWLECATNLGDASPFQTVATNILGAAGTMTFTDASATNAGPYFYRVGVQ